MRDPSPHQRQRRWVGKGLIMGKKDKGPAGARRTKENAETSAVIKELNKKHFIVREGSQVRVFSTRHDPIMRAKDAGLP